VNKFFLYGKSKSIKGGIIMANKRKVTKKQMASLGLKKNENGDYDYINPEDKIKSKYKQVKKSLNK
jgi:hypothetical protein